MDSSFYIYEDTSKYATYVTIFAITMFLLQYEPLGNRNNDLIEN